MNNRLKGVNLYLIGMMGSGKTTVGKILAKRLGYRFFDTDAVVEQAAGQPITEIFATAGEATFRQLETQVLEQLSAYPRLAIATGGGIVLQRQNWSYLHHGVVVWLDVPVEQLHRRLQADKTRPLLQSPNPLERLKTLLEQRRSLYMQADVKITVEEGEAPEHLAERVLEEIFKVLKPEDTALADQPE